VRIAGHPVEGSYPATVLDRPDPAAYNDIDRPDRVAPRATKLALTAGRTVLPPRSLTICHIGLPVEHAAGTADLGRTLSGDWRLTSTGWHHTACSLPAPPQQPR
jgi:hypothetical protein